MPSPIIPYNQNPDQLQTGDILIVSGFIPFIHHYAIVYKKAGIKYVAEIDLEVAGLIINSWKVVSEPLVDYQKRRTVTGYIRNEKTQALTDEYIQSKMVDSAPDGYKLLGYTCEDFIHGIYGCELGYDKKQKSMYVLGFMVIAAFILLYLVFRSKQ